MEFQYTNSYSFRILPIADELVRKDGTQYRYRNFGDRHHCGRQFGCCDSNVLPVELAHADNLRHQGSHILAGVGH